MSKGGLLIMASQFAPRLFQIRRGTWLAIAVGLMALLVMSAWAAFALFGWLWGQGKSLAEGAPEAARAVVAHVEQAVPGARETLGELVPALRPEPPAARCLGYGHRPGDPLSGPAALALASRWPGDHGAL
jgi:hypothetical protein